MGTVWSYDLSIAVILDAVEGSDLPIKLLLQGTFKWGCGDGDRTSNKDMSMATEPSDKDTSMATECLNGIRL